VRPGDRAAFSRILDLLAERYGTRERETRLEPLDELVATILSQHTSDINTARAYASLRARFPTWDEVVEADTAAVEDAIRSGGLAVQKAPRIQLALQAVHSESGAYDLGWLARRETEDALEWLVSLPGVGPKTAACVLLFSLDRPVMPVDTHVGRVATRLGALAERTSALAALRQLTTLVDPPERMLEAHLLLIDHGRDLCKALRPRCDECPVRDLCAYGTTMKNAASTG
jgi:endonuclease III